MRSTWVERIRQAHAGAVESFLEVGRLLIEAKATLPHGEFMAMVADDLPFGQSTANKLMAVASHRFLANWEHVPSLPPSWGTLYELSKLPEPVLEAALDNGRITPEMQRKDVRALLPEKPRQTAPPEPAPDAAEAEAILDQAQEEQTHVDEIQPKPEAAEQSNVEVSEDALPSPDRWPAIWDAFWRDDYLKPEVEAGLKAICEAGSGRVPRSLRVKLARKMADLSRETGRFGECHVVTIALELTSTYLMAEERERQAARDEAQAAAREAERWECPECSKGYRGTALVEVYECGECGETFNAEEGGNRCERCNRFGSKVTDDGCPECSVECELVEEGEAAVDPDGASEEPEDRPDPEPTPAPSKPAKKRKSWKPRPGRRVDS